MNRNYIVSRLLQYKYNSITFTLVVVETIDAKQVYIKHYYIHYNCNIFPIYLITILDRLHSHLIFCRNAIHIRACKCKALNILIISLQCLFKCYTIQIMKTNIPSHSRTHSMSYHHQVLIHSKVIFFFIYTASLSIYFSNISSCLAD